MPLTVGIVRELAFREEEFSVAARDKLGSHFFCPNVLYARETTENGRVKR